MMPNQTHHLRMMILHVSEGATLFVSRSLWHQAIRPGDWCARMVASDQWPEDERLSRVDRSARPDMRIRLARGRGGFPRQADRGRCLSAQDAGADELTRPSRVMTIVEFCARRG